MCQNSKSCWQFYLDITEVIEIILLTNQATIFDFPCHHCRHVPHSPFTIYRIYLPINSFVAHNCETILCTVACLAHIRWYQFGWENAGTLTNNNKHDKTINASNRFTQNVWRKIALHSKWKWKKKGKSNEIGRWLKRSAQKLEVIIMKIALATVTISIWAQVHFLVGNI